MLLEYRKDITICYRLHISKWPTLVAHNFQGKNLHTFNPQTMDDKFSVYSISEMGHFLLIG